MIPKSTYDTETLAFFSSLSAAKRPLSIFSSVCAVHLEAQLSPQGLHRTPITHFTIYSNIYSNFGYISSLWCWLKVNLHIFQYLHLFFDMTVIHPSAWINSRLPVLCFQFFFSSAIWWNSLKARPWNTIMRFPTTGCKDYFHNLNNQHPYLFVNWNTMSNSLT